MCLALEAEDAIGREQQGHPHSSSQGSKSSGCQQGTCGSREAHTFLLPSQDKPPDSNLLIVALQPGLHSIIWGLLLKNTESYPLGQR